MKSMHIPPVNVKLKYSGAYWEHDSLEINSSIKVK